MTKEEIGSILKQLRIASGKTQKEVAEILGRKQQIVGHWETGYSQPDANTLFTLCEIYGTTVDSAFGFKKTNISFHDFKLLEKYNDLDDYGKETINIALERESTRVQQLTELRSRPAAVIDFQERNHPAARLAEYFRSASAGGGVFILGNEATSKISVSESDWDDRVDYVISISGDSMEPDFSDGDKVMVSQRVEIHHGDVGIFVVDGKAYIKEYGETELISRNRKRPNIKISEYNNIVCMGKVIGKLKGSFEIIDD